MAAIDDVTWKRWRIVDWILNYIVIYLLVAWLWKLSFYYPRCLSLLPSAASWLVTRVAGYSAIFNLSSGRGCRCNCLPYHRTQFFRAFVPCFCMPKNGERRKFYHIAWYLYAVLSIINVVGVLLVQFLCCCAPKFLFYYRHQLSFRLSSRSVSIEKLNILELVLVPSYSFNLYSWLLRICIIYCIPSNYILSLEPRTTSPVTISILISQSVWTGRNREAE